MSTVPILNVSPESNLASVRYVEADFADAGPGLVATVPNAGFIADAIFTRDGDNLVLQNGDEAVIVRDYFGSQQPVIEVAGGGDGAGGAGDFTLSPDMVASFLETPGEFYAATNIDADSTGTVSSLEGKAYAIRGGVRIELEKDDAVYKGDTIETSEGGSIEMIFADGTKFALGGDARLSIDEFVFDAGSNEGSQAVSILKGAFSFASGLIAKDDAADMLVRTPVAEIGIRGTKVVGEINPGGESSITVIEGRVLLSNEGGELELSQGFATARVTSAVAVPENLGVITADEAVQRYIAIFDGGRSELNSFVNSEIPEVTIVGEAEEEAEDGAESATQSAARSTAENAEGATAGGAEGAEGVEEAAESATVESATVATESATAGGKSTAEEVAAAEEAAEEVEEAEGGEEEAQGPATQGQTAETAQDEEPAVEEEFSSTEEVFAQLDEQIEDLVEDAGPGDASLGAVGPDDERAVSVALVGFEVAVTDSDDVIASPQIFTATAGVDAFVDSTGLGTVSYEASTGPVNVDLSSGVGGGTGDSMGDSYVGIVDLVGGAGGDTLVGNDDDNMIEGGGGADVIQGHGGEDVLSGGADDDNLHGGAGADVLTGGAGADAFRYVPEHFDGSMDVIEDIEADDVLFFDLFTDATVDDFIFDGRRLYYDVNEDGVADAGEAVIEFANLGLAAGSIADFGSFLLINNIMELSPMTFIGTSEVDAFEDPTGLGTVSYEASTGAVNVDLSSGVGGDTGDSMGDSYVGIVNAVGGDDDDVLVGTDGANRLEGGPGGDTLRGGGGDDVLIGGSGENSLHGGTGADVLSGGSTFDLFYYEPAHLDGSVDEITNIGEGDGLYFFNLPMGITEDDFEFDGNRILFEGEVVAEFSNLDFATGNVDDYGGGEFFIGNIMETPPQTFIGTADADSFNDPTGFGTVDYSASTGAVGVNLATGIGSGGDAEGDVYVGIAHAIGGGGDDVLVGTGEVNALTGGLGADVITGGLGADVLEGGEGADEFVYVLADLGDIDEITDIGVGDTLTFTGMGDAVAGDFRISGNRLFYDGVAIVIFSGFESTDAVVGTVTPGGAGEFTISHIGVPQTFIGTSEVQSFEDATGFGTVDYSTSTTGVSVDLRTGVGQRSEAMDDSYVGVSNVIGGSGSDELIGTDGANRFEGGAGNDNIRGLGGADVLTGGPGGDIFSLGAAEFEKVVITDLEGGDSLFIEGAASAERDRYEFRGNELYYDADGDGVFAVLAEFEGYASVLTSHEAFLALGEITFTVTGGVLDGVAIVGVVSGSTGVDTVTYAGASGAVEAYLDGMGVNGGDASGDSFTGIVNIIGGSGADILGGTDAVNEITGGLGADVLSGGDGDDVFIYSAADLSAGAVDEITDIETGDTLMLSGLDGMASAGDFSFRGNVLMYDGSAIAEFSSFTDSDVFMAADFAAGSDAGSFSITNIRAVVPQTFTGTSEVESFEDATGGGTVDYSGSSDAVEVNLNTGMGGGSGDSMGDVYVGVVHVVGGDGADTLTGTDGANALEGGEGADVITGGRGADVLEGGDGGDEFVYVAADLDGSVDEITDIESGDTLSFSGLGDSATRDDFSFVGNELYYDADTTDDVDGEAIIEFSSFDSATALTADIDPGSDAGSFSITNIRLDALIFDGSAETGHFHDPSGRGTVTYATSGAGVAAYLDGVGTNLGHGMGDTYSGIVNLIGGGGADTLIGNNQNNRIEGRGGSDIIQGAGGADVIEGGEGKDKIDGGGGADMLSGGTGGDTFIYNPGDFGSMDEITDIDLTDKVMLVTGVFTTTDSFFFEGNRLYFDANGDGIADANEAVAEFSNYERTDMLVGTVTGAVAFTITKIGVAQTFDGSGASEDFNDPTNFGTVSYADSTGAVTVNLDTGTGARNDAAGDSYTGIVNVIGGSAGDILTGTDGANMLEGGGGGDTLTGGDGADVLEGGEGADVLRGGEGADVLRGGIGMDTLSGGEGDDVLEGGEGVDMLTGGTGDDVLSGGEGADIFNFVLADLGSRDEITDIESDDTLSFTGLGMAAVAARFIIDGDTLYYDADDDGMLTLDEAVVEFSGFESTDTIGRDVTPGDSGEFTITNIRLLSRTFDGTGESGLFSDMSGLSTVSYADSTGAVTVNLDTGTGARNDAAGDSYSGIVNAIGGSGNDILTGTDEGNVLTGGGGADILSGGLGVDTFVYALADFFDGTVVTAKDTISDIEAGDRLSFTGLVGAGVDVFIVVGNVLYYDVDGDGAGDAGEEIIEFSGIGSLAGSVADEGDGEFTIRIAAADEPGTIEVINGGSLFFDSSGMGTVSYAGASIHVRYDLLAQNGFFESGVAQDYVGIINGISGDAGSTTFGDDRDNVMVGGAGRDGMTANDGADTLIGGAGADTIDAGAGADTLRGGTGADILFGDMGVDTFVYEASDLDGSKDTIADIAVGETITFRGLGSEASADYFVFVGNKLYYNADGGVDGDGNPTVEDDEFVANVLGYSMVDSRISDDGGGDFTITIIMA